MAFVPHTATLLNPWRGATSSFRSSTRQSDFAVILRKRHRPSRSAVVCSDELLPRDVDLAESLREEERRDPFEGLLSDATTVSLPMPLGVVMEELPTGEVFIDELAPDGNAMRSGLLDEGDIVLAVSTPFGDGLALVPQEEALTAIEDFILTRGDDSFTLVVRKGADVEALREKAAQPQGVNMEEVFRIGKIIFEADYPPYFPDDDDDDLEDEQTMRKLREAGFHMDSDVSIIDPQTVERMNSKDMYGRAFEDALNSGSGSTGNGTAGGLRAADTSKGSSSTPERPDDPRWEEFFSSDQPF